MDTSSFGHYRYFMNIIKLTQEQHSNTIKNDCPTPAVPTIQVNRRNSITPRMFCNVGRYTPIIVPIFAG